MSLLLGCGETLTDEIKKNGKGIDMNKLLDLIETKDLNRAQLSREMGISPVSLSRRMADLRTKQGLLLSYKTLQSLHLTELQARVLEAITPDKIETASLTELCQAFKILKDKELAADGKPNELKGLVHYLVEMEKREIHADNPPEDEFTDAEFESEEEELPNL